MRGANYRKHMLQLQQRQNNLDDSDCSCHMKWNTRTTVVFLRIEYQNFLVTRNCILLQNDKAQRKAQLVIHLLKCGAALGVHNLKMFSYFG